jgi:hypothetical protein
VAVTWPQWRRRGCRWGWIKPPPPPPHANTSKTGRWRSPSPSGLIYPPPPTPIPAEFRRNSAKKMFYFVFREIARYPFRGHPASHCNGNSVYIFLFWELRGLSPNFHIHVSVSDLYIPRIGPRISSSRKGRPIVEIYNSWTDTWIWKLGLRPRYSFSGNICFKFSAFCLCSARKYSSHDTIPLKQFEEAYMKKQLSRPAHGVPAV